MEIDHHAIKLLIGALAFSLPWIELYLSAGSITSISSSYWVEHGPWPRTLFIGFLFAISAFMFAYNGEEAEEMWLAKGAAVAALVLAMFPCECGDPAREIIPRLHLIATIVLFGVLIRFCYIFKRRAKEECHRAADRRAFIYRVCGWGMFVSVALFAAYLITKREPLVFWGEAVGLGAFGIAWLTASRTIRIRFLNPDWERNKLWVRTRSDGNPLTTETPSREADR